MHIYKDKINSENVGLNQASPNTQFVSINKNFCIRYKRLGNIY